MNRTINLTAVDQLLRGKYSPGDVVLVLCDATKKALTVLLPDARGVKDVIFYIKKTDASVNTITVSALSQKINKENTSVLENQNDINIYLSDLLNYHCIPNHAVTTPQLPDFVFDNNLDNILDNNLETVVRG